MKLLERIGWVFAAGVFAAVLVVTWRRTHAPPEPERPAAEAPRAVQAPIPAGSLVKGPFRARFTLFVLGDPLGADVRATALARERVDLDVVPVGTDSKSDRLSLSVNALDSATRPPPGAETLRWFGRGIDEPLAKRLATPSATLALEFTGPVERAGTLLQAATSVVHAVARGLDAVVWDDDTSEAFSVAAFEQRRVAAFDGDLPIVPRHCIVHTYKDGGGSRTVTLGMGRLGLPDLVVENHRPQSGQFVVALVGAAQQALFEQGAATRAGELDVDAETLKNKAFRESLRKSVPAAATLRATLPLADGRVRKGDSERLVELAFPDQATLGRTLATFLGQPNP